MVTDLILGIIYSILNLLTSWLPVASTCTMTGLSTAGTFIAGAFGTTSAFVPWTDIFTIIGILLTITGVRLIMQVINLLWP